MPYKNKIVGIYLITFKTKERTYKYIGHSVNCQQRNKQHLDGLKFNRHDNPIMQNLWNKYGEEAYNFKVIVKDLNRELLHVVEQCYINMIKDVEKINIASANRHVMTDDMKQKISDTRKQRIAKGKISLAPAMKAKSLNRIKRENTTKYKFTHKKTGESFIASVTQLSEMFNKKTKVIKKNIAEVLNPNSRSKALYGYYIDRTS